MSTKPLWIRTLYWSCQILGWSTWSGLGLTMIYLQNGRLYPHQVIGYALFILYSIGLTHLLGRTIERRAWLALSMPRAMGRIAGAGLATSTIQTALIIVVSFVLSGTFVDFAQLAAVAYLWLNITFATGIWTALYTTISSWLRASQAREQAAALEQGMNEARLKALEAQISPHFLFNCLNSIRGMIAENPTQAQDMVTRLANILRHNLTRDASPTETLGEQVAFTNDYLALESIRFEERLRTRFEIDPATNGCAIPSMLLQVLVENAIKHGISHLPEGGEVVVTSRFENNSLVIEVQNTGRLVPTPTESTCVGLSNLRERLRVVHGPDAALQLAGHEPEVVRATVTIPRTRL